MSKTKQNKFDKEKAARLRRGETNAKFQRIPQLSVGDEVPDFIASTQFGNIHFHDFVGGQWTMLFSYGQAFEPTSTTELGAVAHLQKEFTARNCNILAIGVESLERVKSWKVEVDKVCKCDMKYPVINDTDGSCLRLCCMLDRPERFCRPWGEDGAIRAQSVIILVDPFKIVRFRSDHPVTVGRNFYEVLRVLDSLQLKDYQLVSTPANWEQGDALLVPPTTPETQIPVLYPLGVNKQRPYLWTTNFEDVDDQDSD
eukprot:g1496.t1